MKHETLKEQIECVSEWADAVFADAGEILPMWHAIDADGTNHIIPALMPDKDAMAAALRAFCKEKNAVRLMFITEAWTCATDDQKVAEQAMAWMRAGKTLESFPGRIEVLMFSCEDETGTLNAHRRIIRGEGKPTLGPLEWFPANSTLEGRFTNMLGGTKCTKH